MANCYNFIIIENVGASLVLALFLLVLSHFEPFGMNRKGDISHVLCLLYCFPPGYGLSLLLTLEILFIDRPPLIPPQAMGELRVSISHLRFFSLIDPP